MISAMKDSDILERVNRAKAEYWKDLDALTVYPDIIIHRRKIDEENLVVIEAKKSNNTDEEWDKVKLRFFKELPYSYQMALFVRFRVGARKDAEIQRF